MFILSPLSNFHKTFDNTVASFGKIVLLNLWYIFIFFRNELRIQIVDGRIARKC